MASDGGEWTDVVTPYSEDEKEIENERQNEECESKKNEEIKILDTAECESKKNDEIKILDTAECESKKNDEIEILNTTTESGEKKMDPDNEDTLLKMFEQSTVAHSLAQDEITDNLDEDIDFQKSDEFRMKDDLYKQKLDSISSEHAVTLPNARRYVTLCLNELQEKKEKGLDMTMQWPYQEKVNPPPLSGEDSRKRVRFLRKFQRFHGRGRRGRGRGRGGPGRRDRGARSLNFRDDYRSNGRRNSRRNDYDDGGRRNSGRSRRRRDNDEYEDKYSNKRQRREPQHSMHYADYSDDEMEEKKQSDGEIEYF